MKKSKQGFFRQRSIKCKALLSVMFFSVLGVNSYAQNQVEDYPQDIKDNGIQGHSGNLSRPTFRNSSTDFINKKPGDEITISVKQEEGSACGIPYIELQVSSINFGSFTTDELREISSYAATDADDQLMFYRKFIHSWHVGDIENFKVRIDECLIDKQIFVRTRAWESHCTFRKRFRYSSWRYVRYEISESGEFYQPDPIRNSVEVKCGDTPYDGVVPQFFKRKINDPASQADVYGAADQNVKIDWYRNKLNNGLFYKTTTEGPEKFSPLDAYPNNNNGEDPRAKETSFWKYEAENKCDIEKLADYARRPELQQYLTVTDPIILPIGDQLRGSAVFIRHDTQEQITQQFGGDIPVHLYDTDELACAEEIKCGIENLNRFTLNYAQIKNAVTLTFGDAARVTARGTRYFGENQITGEFEEDQYMTRELGGRRMVCFDDLLNENSIHEERRYKILSSVDISYVLPSELCDMVPEMCGKTQEISCEVYIIFNVIPHGKGWNDVNQVDNLPQEAKDAYAYYSQALENATNPVTGLYNCNDVAKLHRFVDDKFRDLHNATNRIGKEPTNFVDQRFNEGFVKLPFESSTSDDDNQDITNDKDVVYRWMDDDVIVHEGYYYEYPNLPIDSIKVLTLQASVLNSPFQTIHVAKVSSYSWIKPDTTIDAELDGPILISIKGVNNAIEDTLIVIDPRENKVTSPFDVNEDLVDMNVYPNPTSDGFNIELIGFSSESNADLYIYNVQGQLVDQVSLTEAKKLYYANKLESGNYTLMLVTDDKVVYKKLIVNN